MEILNTIEINGEKVNLIKIGNNKVITLKDISRVYKVPYISFKNIFKNKELRFNYNDDYIELKKEGVSITDLKRIEENPFNINSPTIPIYAFTLDGCLKLFNIFEEINKRNKMLIEKNFCQIN